MMGRINLAEWEYYFSDDEVLSYEDRRDGWIWNTCRFGDYGIYNQPSITRAEVLELMERESPGRGKREI